MVWKVASGYASLNGKGRRATLPAFHLYSKAEICPSHSFTLTPLSRHYYLLFMYPSIYSQKSCKIYHLFCNFFHFFCISDQNTGFQLTYRPYYLCLCWLSPFSTKRYRILRSIRRNNRALVAKNAIGGGCSHRQVEWRAQLLGQGEQTWLKEVYRR